MKLLPPEQRKLAVLIVAGIFVGLFIFLFYASNAYSYLSDNPDACVNCHIMSSQYATWNHGSHRRYATCSDCHVPQNNVLNRYLFKTKDGICHAWMFSLHLEPQVILIHESGIGAVQQNCIRCHSSLLLNLKPVSSIENQKAHVAGRICWECHREVPHGKVNSLSSTPNARIPLPGSIVPDWVKKTISDN